MIVDSTVRLSNNIIVSFLDLVAPDMVVNFLIYFCQFEKMFQAEYKYF